MRFTEEENARCRAAGREHDLQREVESLKSEVARLEDEVVRLENLNKMWVGIKADREERIAERDEARALAIAYLSFKASTTTSRQREISRFPWLEDE